MENSYFLKVCQDSPFVYGQEKDETLERTRNQVKWENSGRAVHGVLAVLLKSAAECLSRPVR